MSYRCKIQTFIKDCGKIKILGMIYTLVFTANGTYSYNVVKISTRKLKLSHGFIHIFEHLKLLKQGLPRYTTKTYLNNDYFY